MEEVDDAGLSMPQFDEVMAEQPTTVVDAGAEEPSQDMPDVGAVDQVRGFAKINLTLSPPTTWYLDFSCFN